MAPSLADASMSAPWASSRSSTCAQAGPPLTAWTGVCPPAPRALARAGSEARRSASWPALPKAGQVEDVPAVIEQQIAQLEVAGVVGEAHRRGMVLALADLAARSTGQQELDDLGVVGPGRLVEGDAAILLRRVRIGAQLQQQPGRRGVVDRFQEQGRVLDQAGRGLQQLSRPTLVSAHHRGGKPVFEGQLPDLGAVPGQHLRDLGIAVEQGVLVVGAAVVDVGGVDVGAVLEQERHPFHVAHVHRLGQLVVQGSDRRVPVRVDDVGGLQPVGQEQLQPLVVRREHGVVETLRVIRIGACVEQDLGQLAGPRVGRLLKEALLAFAHGSGEPRPAPAAQLPGDQAGIAVGARGEQHLEGGHRVAVRRVLGNPAVADVEQRRPVPGLAGGDGGAIRRQVLSQGLHVEGGRGGMAARPGDLRRLGEHPGRLLAAAGVIGAEITQARQIGEAMSLLPQRCPGLARRTGAAGWIGGHEASFLGDGVPERDGHHTRPRERPASRGDEQPARKIPLAIVGRRF